MIYIFVDSRNDCFSCKINNQNIIKFVHLKSRFCNEYKFSSSLHFLIFFLFTNRARRTFIYCIQSFYNANHIILWLQFFFFAFLCAFLCAFLVFYDSLLYIFFSTAFLIYFLCINSILMPGIYSNLWGKL